MYIFLYLLQKTERPNTVNIYAESEQDLFLRDERLKGEIGDMTTLVDGGEHKMNLSFSRSCL